MNSFSKWFKGLGIIVAIVAAGITVGWLATRESGHKPPVPPPVPNVDTRPPNRPPPLAEHPSRPVVPTTGPDQVNTDVTSRPGRGSPAVVPANVVTNWDERLDDILASDTDDTNKLKELFALFPRIPEEGQVEVAQHLSNLVEDEDYVPLGKLLEDAKLPESVLDVLMADLLNRPNGVKLPMFLDIARNPDHAKAEEAKELLELYLDEDYGNDWAKWDEKLKEWMKENPD